MSDRWFKREDAMPGKTHVYRPTVEWTGNTGSGTSDYRAYERAHVISAPGKADILGSSDPGFRGDGTRWSPEDLFVASVSTCHQLWYLHLCADAGIVVLAYRDEPIGTMIEDADGSGRFVSVVLHPTVEVAAGSDRVKAISLHHDAHAMCFIANSVSCAVSIVPSVIE
jgi:organic hydroperoxide reductase OsmC/OhrA